MDIRNITEFRNFVDRNGLRSLHHDIEAVSICVADYERGCSCWNAGDRDKVYNNCKCLYLKSVGISIRQFAPQFLAASQGQAINFLQDGNLIGSIRR